MESPEDGEIRDPSLTSEVGIDGSTYGFPRHISHSDHRSISETGHPEETSANQLKDFLRELVNKLPGNKPQALTLPVFNPDSAMANPKSWLLTVDLCLLDQQCEGSYLILALSNSLKGSAALWFTRILHPNLNWKEFKILFTTEYIQCETPAATMTSLLNTTPKDTTEYTSFAIQVLATLDSCFKDLSREEIGISLVLGMLSKIDRRIQHLSSTREIRSREALLRELKFFSTGGRRPPVNQVNQPEAKRMRPYCRNCRIPGHHTSDCRKARTASAPTTERVPRFPSERDRPTPSPSRPFQGHSREATCYACKQTGHFANKCPKRKPADKHVGICSAKPIGQLEHNGEKYSFLFDSGSECSLIVASLAPNVQGKRLYETVNLHGLGNSIVPSTSQIKALLTINEINVHVVFHVIPDKYLSDLIIIGREILSEQLDMVIEKSKCYLRSRVPTEPSNLNKTKEESPSKPIIQTNLGILSEDNDLVTHLNSSLERDDESPSNLEKKVEVVLCNDFLNISNNAALVPSQNVYDSIVTELSPDDSRKLFSILDTYRPFFINGIPKTRVKTGEMKIRLKDPSKINFQRPYKLGPVKQTIVRKLVSDLLDAKVIRPSSSPYSSPAFPVPKGTGDYRLCVDYRALNENTVPEHFPLPLIQDQIARLTGASFYVSLDMASGYHQIPIHADSVEKTSFITYHGTWEYLAVPFGLRNAGSVFQRAVMEALGDLAHDYVLTNAGFSLNLKKCSFVVKRITYLGYDIENGEIRPNSKKIDALTKLPPPKTLRSLRQFLGLASYFRQFIQNFSQITAPLYRLIATANSLDSKIIKWLPEHEKIRQKLISLLTSSPVLVIFDPNLPIELHTDASSSGYAGILINIVHGKPRAVAYYSKRTTPAESNYHSYELETMAVVKSIEHFNNYLQGNSFKVVTDCLSLKATQSKKDLIPRVQRWWSFLQSYNFTIEYRKAERMSHVDFLSRNPLDLEQENIPSSSLPSSNTVKKYFEEQNLAPLNGNESRTPLPKIEAPASSSHDKNSNSAEARIAFKHKRVNLTSITPDWLLAEQNKDSELNKIKDQLKNSNIDSEIRNTHEIRSGILCRKIQRNGTTRCLPIVPHTLKWAIVNNIHNSIFHMGWEKTVETLYNHYWFEKMSKFTRKFVDNCLTCKVNKTDSGAKQIQLHPIPKTNIPWHTVHLDTTGKLSGKNDSKEYLFVFIDAFTKFTLLSHTKKIDSESATRALSNVIDLFGPPSLLIVDQGRSFANKNFKELCSRLQIELHFIATGACRANGQVERQMRVLKNMLTIAEAEENKSWQQAVGEIQLAINSTPHRVTKFSPMELMFGRVSRPRNVIIAEGDITDREEVDLNQIRAQASIEMEKSASYSKTNFDKGKAKVKPFVVGDSVLLKNEERNQTKLDPKYRGPFIVKRVLDNDRYEIESSDGKRVFKYSHDRMRLIPNTSEINPSLDLSSDGED
ncbi:hypothetical protein WDU94_005469 [Cyamophila willieti]